MKIGRNDPCPCGSGKKYKHCCYAKDSVKQEPEGVADPAESPPEEESTEARDERETQKREQRRDRGRARFQGDARGGTTSFNPRTFRGSQRGT